MLLNEVERLQKVHKAALVACEELRGQADTAAETAKADIEALQAGPLRI